MRYVHFEYSSHLIFNSITLLWGHAELFDLLLTVAVCLLRVGLLAPHGCDDVAGRFKHGVQECFVARITLPPVDPAISRHLIVYLKNTACSNPLMAHAVDDDAVVPAPLCHLNQRNVSLRGVRLIERGMVEWGYI